MKYLQGTDGVHRGPRHRATWSVLSLRLRPLLTAVAAAWALLAIPALHAQNARPTDYQVKATYLYNFGRFIEWPGKVAAAEGGSFTVCVLGQDPFGPSLDATLAGETIGGRTIVAKRISSAEESGNCQIIFLSLADDSRLNKIIADLDKKAVLTVSDMPQFVKRGGMIQFVAEGKKVRFEVNLTATQHAGLTLSSELLKVATAVRKDRE
jgi:YfiR/HmsC-like